uniref:Uncharacterized protein n=1 Tax=Salmonella sp. TaxID=599 RepID=A0A482EUC6_SALSP|nr:hypothetical protein NNIBIDOC_00094 [Salmonella sp.]
MTPLNLTALGTAQQRGSNKDGLMIVMFRQEKANTNAEAND